MEEKYPEITLTESMLKEAEKLNTGKVIFAYRDGLAIRIETENGYDPYVWRAGHWVNMGLV